MTGVDPVILTITITMTDPTTGEILITRTGIITTRIRGRIKLFTIITVAVTTIPPGQITITIIITITGQITTIIITDQIIIITGLIIAAITGQTIGIITVTTIIEGYIMPMLVMITMGDNITKVAEVTMDITAEAAATVRDKNPGIILTGAIAVKTPSRDQTMETTITLETGQNHGSSCLLYTSRCV